MGIPSFYKYLLRRHKGITSGSPQLLAGCSSSIDIFALDFNCIVYAAMGTMSIHKELPYETRLLNEVGKWLDRLVEMVGPKEIVYISVDGPVPCAKIKQQRLRRFKSKWLHRHENKIREYFGKEPKEIGWDRNSITPGTEFMTKLNFYLHKYVSSASEKGIKYILTDSCDQGEGEHKIMKWLSTAGIKNKTVAVYGLDADLILLGMLHSQLTDNRIILCREPSDKELKSVDFLTLQYFSPVGAAVALRKESNACADVPMSQWIQDYVAVMSLLGNDFMPHSLGFSIRDGAVQEVLQALEVSCKKLHGQRLTNGSAINVDVLYLLLGFLAGREEKLIAHTVKSKKTAHRPILRKTEQVERALEEAEWEPTFRGEEDFLMNSEGKWLHDGWRKTLETHCFSSSEDHVSANDEWLYGFQWVNAYYHDSTSINIEWYFPFSTAPLFSSLRNHLGTNGLPFIDQKENIVIKPIEQLIMVLPPQSYHLLPSSVVKLLERDAWMYNPLDFALQYFGKKLLWECEPIIPMLPLDVVKNLIAKVANDLC
jgi:5'-3' exonuclease